jgi:hypothetical protein
MARSCFDAPRACIRSLLEHSPRQSHIHVLLTTYRKKSQPALADAIKMT